MNRSPEIDRPWLDQLNIDWFFIELLLHARRRSQLIYRQHLVDAFDIAIKRHIAKACVR